MSLSLRQSEILEITRSEGRVIVEDLAQRFEAALQTIRRDLADAGLLDRVHGGAVARTGVATPGYEQRRNFLVCDHSKLGRSAPARRCSEWGTEVHVAEA